MTNYPLLLLAKLFPTSDLQSPIQRHTDTTASPVPKTLNLHSALENLKWSHPASLVTG